jgi:hypothetical protein
MEIMDFLTILVLVFALVLLIAGIFSAGFGSGKSRKIGAALLIVGLIVMVAWIYLVGWSDMEMFADVDGMAVVKDAAFNIIAALIGALAAVGIFLVAIMKS